MNTSLLIQYWLFTAAENNVYMTYGVSSVLSPWKAPVADPSHGTSAHN